MRGRIFENPDSTPHFATVNPHLSDAEIYETEKRMVADGWKPIPTAEEIEEQEICPACGYPKNIDGQHWGEPVNRE